MADKVGNYQGSSANISGEGFSGMTFAANSVSGSDFAQWVELIKQYRNDLSLTSYNRLAKPSKNNPLGYYSSVDPNLYHQIVNKYYRPGIYRLGGTL